MERQEIFHLLCACRTIALKGWRDTRNEQRARVSSRRPRWIGKCGRLSRCADVQARMVEQRVLKEDREKFLCYILINKIQIISKIPCGESNGYLDEKMNFKRNRSPAYREPGAPSRSTVHLKF